MKRKLDEQEKKATEKGVVLVTGRIRVLQESVDYNERSIAFQKAQDDYQDFARPYLRKKKLEEDNKIMATIKQTLAGEEATLDNLQDQLKHGVEIKKVKK